MSTLYPIEPRTRSDFTPPVPMVGGYVWVTQQYYASTYNIPVSVPRITPEQRLFMTAMEVRSVPT